MPEAPVRLAPMFLTRRSTLPPTVAASANVAIRDPQAGCADCSARRSCLPRGLEPDAVRQFDALVAKRKRLRRGQALYRVGDPCSVLYAVRVGSCKTTVIAEDGHEQVCGYHLRGDVLGMDSIHEGRHRSQAVALEQSEVCALPFARVVEMSRRVPSLQRTLHRLLACECDRNHNLMQLIRGLGAEERVAAFLLNLAHRYAQCGQTSTGFVLRMTRLDIGSYLGIKMETVSRALTHLQEEGLIQMKHHSVELLDVLALKQLVRQHGLRTAKGTHNGHAANFVG